MANKTESFLKAMETLASEKKITSEEIAEVLKESIAKAYTKDDPDFRIEVDVDLKRGELSIFHLLKVVLEETDDFDDIHEIILADALKTKADVKIGDDIKSELKFSDAKPDLARYILQIFKQRIAELSNKKIVEEWSPRLGEVIFAEYEKQEEKGGGIVDLGTTKGFLDRKGVVKGEVLQPGKKYWFAIKAVTQQSHGWPVILSRTDGAILKHMLETNIPEIADGTIEIKNIARMSGQKSKVAVISHNKDFDPIGAIIGKEGEKIKQISKELHNELIDILIWNENPQQIVVNAIAPVNVLGINIVEDSEKDRSMEVIVGDDFLPNVIGRAGINVKLLARLTGWNIDIKSETQALEDNIEYARNDLIAEGFNNFARRTKFIKRDDSGSRFGSRTRISDKLSAKPVSYTTKEDDDNLIEVDMDVPEPVSKQYDVYEPSKVNEGATLVDLSEDFGLQDQTESEPTAQKPVEPEIAETPTVNPNSITTLISEIDMKAEPKRAMKEVKTQTSDKKKKDKDNKSKKSQRKSLDDFALLDLDALPSTDEASNDDQGQDSKTKE
ncbi:transcription termination factor NusA [[Mycoplasma] testudinis]|uniref:transcription termination factor NusA n=1 Tax=[Mycoplasma] testudinis TaxID=33924 RepID=UPI00048424E0|nr:transcription termination factor NusA [[Mycoplasma] testudinis]